MLDSFQHSIDSPIAPAQLCFTISPSDIVELPRVTKAIYVGDGGAITLLSVAGDTDVTFHNVVAGSILDVRVRAIRATGTTATNLIGLA